MTLIAIIAAVLVWLAVVVLLLVVLRGLDEPGDIEQPEPREPTPEEIEEREQYLRAQMWANPWGPY